MRWFDNPKFCYLDEIDGGAGGAGGDGIDVGGEDDPFMVALTEMDIEDPDSKDSASTDDKKVEGEDKTAQFADDIKNLQVQVTDLLEKNKGLNRALHEERQSRKAAKTETSEEAVLSEADLAKIIEEHKDDPAVLLNAVKYMVKQQISTGKTEAVNEVEVKQKATTLNNILRERYGDSLTENEQLRSTVDKVKDYLNVKDHPFGDAIGAAGAVFLQLPNLLKAQYERGVKEATDGTAEKNRQVSIRNGQHVEGKVNGAGGPARDTKTGLTDTELETAKQLGFKPGTPKFNIYVRQIKGRSAGARG